MVLALQRDKSGAGNASGKHPPSLEWNDKVAAHMHHEANQSFTSD